MSLFVWNSVAERKNVLRMREEFQQLVQYATNRMQDDSDSEDDSSSSGSSMSESSSGSDDELYELVVTAGANYMDYKNKIYGTIHDPNVDFGQRKMIQDISESDGILYFRFRPAHLRIMADALWPRLSPFLGPDINRIVVRNRYTAPYETCLLVYLFKMARPVRLRPECERYFGMQKSHISAIIHTFGDALFELAQDYLFDPRIWHHRMEYYSRLISAKCHNLLGNIWGFIDGTIRKTCRPILYQQLLYTRYKRCHGIKFQSVVTPDGFIACLYGPYIGKRHDARIFRESGILEMLQDLMPADGANGPVYALYGDLAYPQSIWLFGGFVNPARNSPQAIFNRHMSSARIAVEWGFNNILRKWAHLDCEQSMQIFKQPIAQQFINCCFFTNIMNCFYGNVTCDYFAAHRMSLEQYLALADNVN